jgi:hypothetical protein
MIGVSTPSHSRFISYQFHAKVFARKNFSVEPKVSEAKSIISYDAVL